MKSKELKIALIGNMNNNFFVLQRYLLDQGISCHLFILPDEPEHFLPENDSWKNNISDLYTRLNWGKVSDFSSISKEQIKNQFKEYSNIIACGPIIAFLSKAGIRIDVFIPYGSDLYSLPFSYPNNPIKWLNKFLFNKSIRKGIKDSKCISLADNSEQLFSPLKKIGFNGKMVNSGVPMVYSESKVLEKSKYFNEFSAIREKNDLVIFHHSRHVWKTIDDPVSIKRNDKLIGAIARLIKDTDAKIALVTLEYGIDVDESKKLVSKLDIDSNVFWFPKMARKELMTGIHFCDIVAGEFNHSWFTYGVVFEAMSEAKPVLHYREDNLYKEFNLYPMLNAHSEEDIYNVLNDSLKDKGKISSIGEEGKKWYYDNFVKKSISDIVSSLN